MRVCVRVQARAERVPEGMSSSGISKEQGDVAGGPEDAATKEIKKVRLAPFSPFGSVALWQWVSQGTRVSEPSRCVQLAQLWEIMSGRMTRLRR